MRNVLKVKKSIDGIETNVMTMYFYQSGLILIQGQKEDFMCYKNETFLKIMKGILPKMTESLLQLLHVIHLKLKSREN